MARTLRPVEPPANSLRQVKERLTTAVLEGVLAPAELPAKYAAHVDTRLAGVFAEAAGKTAEGFALVAVGGYGRRELCPGSDLDVTLLHHRRRNVREVADRIWYAVWDSGIRLDHSVRTPKEAISIAREDQRALLGLLDGRLVAGDAALVGGLLEGVAEWWRTHARELLGDLAASARQRHERFGEVAFLLEPDLKQAAGGLRDLDALSLAARGAPRLAPVLLPASLADHRRLLLGSRVALHARTGGSSDRLVLQEQDEIAPLLGHVDADALMGAIAAAGREVMWATTGGWRRLESFFAGPLGRAGGRDIPVAEGVVLRDGEVAMSPGAGGMLDGSLLVRLAAAAAAYQNPIATATLDRLAASEIEPPDVWTSELRQSFLSLLEYGAAATVVLEALDQRRLLERLLPEWPAVRHRPQRNAYHRFTVDRHLLEATAQAALLIRSVRRPDLLLVASLLHDIGKGQGGDHSEAGAVVAVGVANRMGFDKGDTEAIGRLVRHHLLLADVATRRDLDDPASVAAVASAVGDRDTLEVLARLTEADSIATGPTAWSSWKAELVSELVARVDAHLAGGQTLSAGPPRLPSERSRRLAEGGFLEVVVENTTVTVVAPDRPGLLSLVAGTLALSGLDIHGATAMDGGNSMAVEVFEVDRMAGGAHVDHARLRADLELALSGELLLAARLADLEATYARGRRPAAAQPAQVRVLVDDASSLATVVEVRAPDSRGLLYRLTRVLAESGLDVISARVSTMGHEVVDAFYVKESGGGGRPGTERLRDVASRLVTEADPGPVRGTAGRGGPAPSNVPAAAK
jgi:[protein-PII] uridylyltransferase